MGIAETFLKELIDDLKNNRLVLPTLPEVALKVRDAVNDENASTKDIAKVISSDAAISARLLQFANSPLMRASQPIDNLEGAVNRLGMRLVKDTVTSMAMEQMFQATSDVTDRKLREIWDHSSQVAAISHALASQFTKLKPEQAMLAGLVHDIGALPILTKAEDTPELLADETKLDYILLTLHSQIGAAILKTWNFPPELVAVAADHEKLDRDSTETDYVDVVQVANLQSYMDSKHPLAQADWDNIPAFAKLGLAPDVNVIELDQTAKEIEEVKAMLGS
ncbi:MAG: HDOD domain-containing protein [Gammaproteobacteria bacterium]|nr:HDOD domain-containing protein [Gammaproteobacteria bacterium]